MVYLKEYYLFNSYKQVDISEFRKRPDIDISESLLSKVVSVMKNNNITDYTYYGKYICFNTDEVGVDISVDNDEWFKVSILYFSNSKRNRAKSYPTEYKGEQIYYLCDQYEGLLEFFKDIAKLNISVLENFIGSDEWNTKHQKFTDTVDEFEDKGFGIGYARQEVDIYYRSNI